MDKTTADVLKAMRSLAVIPVATGVLHAKLEQMRQGADEVFRTFAAKVRGKAETCSFKVRVTCECSKVIEADYTDEMIRDGLLSGISDMDF
jgi:hypothetical protein